MHRGLVTVSILIATLTAGAAAAQPLRVDAGRDQTVTIGQEVQLDGYIAGSGDIQIFWSKQVGPGVVQFMHEQFKSSFETGDASEWTSGGGGNQTGHAYVTDKFGRSGKHSWRAQNAPTRQGDSDIAAKLLRWRFDYDKAYYSGWFWWPADYNSIWQRPPTEDYCNIFQFKEQERPHRPSIILAVLSDRPGAGTKDVIAIHDAGHGNSPGGFHRGDLQKTEVRKGQWNHLIAYAEQRKSGRLVAWLNGVRIFDRSGLDFVLGSEQTMWGVGNYGGDAIGKHIFWDDLSISRAVPGIEKTNAIFSQPGLYVLRLTASSPSSTVHDDVVVSVQGGANNGGLGAPGKPMLIQ